MGSKENIHILGISGSLRSDSSNTNILNVIADLLPDYVTFKIFQQLDQISPFSPGKEENGAVRGLKNDILNANGVIICTPEYAFGIPGTLKNALDWTVSTGEFNDKPVSAISASPLNSGGDKALASLLLTLTALGTKRNGHSSLSIPNIKIKMNAFGKLTDQQTIDALQFQTNNLLELIG